MQFFYVQNGQMCFSKKISEHYFIETIYMLLHCTKNVKKIKTNSDFLN